MRATTAVLAVLAVVAAASAGAAPVKLIIDTDIGGGGCKDVDDVAAVCIGNALADNGEVELLATVVNTKPPKCPGVVSVLNSWYGRGDSVPIGSYKGADLPEGEHLPYVDDLPDHFPSTVKNASQVPDAVEVYRRVLAAQPDGSVTISSIGLHTNLRALLLSQADAHSSLGGRELVAAKVKALWVMGGKYPTSVGTGFAECNVAGGGGDDHPTGAAASSYVAAHWPAQSQLVWSGFDVGGPVKCAGQLATCAPASNPCRQAFLDTTKGNAHASFDPLTTLAAVRGPEAVGTAFCTDCDGTNVIDAASGDNTWKAGPASNQSYLVLKDATAAGAALDKLLCQPPAHPPAPTPPPPTPPPPPMRSGVTIHIAKHPTVCIGVPAPAEDVSDGMDVVLVDCANGTAKLWDLQPAAGAQEEQWRVMPHLQQQQQQRRGTGTGTGTDSRYCLTVDSRHGDVPSGAPAVLTPCDAARDDQLWSFTGAGDTSCVSNGATGKYLSVSGLADPYLGQFIEVWSPKKTEAKAPLGSDADLDCGPAEDWQAHFAVAD